MFYAFYFCTAECIYVYSKSNDARGGWRFGGGEKKKPRFEKKYQKNTIRRRGPDDKIDNLNFKGSAARRVVS